jgi:hypothetical protein
MRWYGDNSELTGIWNAEMPDILFFGGIAISDAEGQRLHERIAKIKRGYSKFGAFPIKWNFKDCRPWFDKHKHPEAFEPIQRESKTWRRAVIEAAADIDFQIIVSCVKHHSAEKQVIKRTRNPVARFAFSNALMRIGLLAAELNPDYFEVVLDWPDSGDSSPYTDEYRTALWEGKCHHSPEVQYNCGPLSALGFRENLLFTQMQDCPLMQFSDLVIGAVREFVDYALDKKNKDALGVRITKQLAPKFRGFPGRIIGRGISVAPTDSLLRKALFKKMLTLRAEAA